MSCISVITTINPPTKSVRTLAGKIPVIVVGDKKTPSDWSLPNCDYINPAETPFNHYARKNFGYLEAMRRGATVIYDTDDDNIPNEKWKIRDISHETEVIYKKGWLNIYAAFDRDGWPRGFSLREIKGNGKYDKRVSTVISPIQQGLSDGEPDVDAIWRLTSNKEITFYFHRSIHLYPSAWCPFNSQSTWWFPQAYALMYLPVNASFRMTDIWRSFVAQRCLWEIGAGVAFHSPAEVYQDRNPHDLMKDFEDEIPGYLHNDRIVKALTELKLSGTMAENMVTCYECMVGLGVLPSKELLSLKKWHADIAEVI